jgi:DNA transformation protein and related proteins
MKPPVNAMLNLGPKSRQWLAEVGVHDLEDLSTRDAVEVYLAVKSRQSQASVNLLYALAGAQQGVHWQVVAREQRSQWLMRLDQAEELNRWLASQTPEGQRTP